MDTLTDLYLRTLKPRVARFEVTDAKAHGLRIRVSPSGKKTWVFVFRQYGRLYRKTLGRYPTVTLAEARAQVAADREGLEKKVNPVTAAKEADRQAALIEARDPLISDLCTLYIERYASVNKKTWREDQRVLLKDVVPRWGTLRASEVKRVHLVSLLDDLVARGAGVAANRTFATVRKMFNFAVSRAILEYSPCQGIEKPVKEQARQLVLTRAEVISFWHNLDRIEITDPVRWALRFLLVTGQRPGEVAGLRLSELDEEHMWWTLPEGRSKNGLSHRVPLSPLARHCLDCVPHDDVSDFAFRSRIAETPRPIGPNALDHAVRLHRTALGFNPERVVTPRDLRRTAASWMAASGVLRLTIAKILNHVETGITAVYDRHSYDGEKRDAPDRWSGQLVEMLDLNIIGK